MNRNLLIALDKFFFKPLFYLCILFSKLYPPEKSYGEIELAGTEHFLIIRPGGAGDGLMSIPLMRILRERFPNSRISLLCVKKSLVGLKYLPYYDDIIILDDLRRIPKNLFSLLTSQYDIVFDLEQFRVITSVISYFTRAKVRVGFDTNNRRLLYTHLISYFNDKQYESLNFIRQLEIIGIETAKNDAIDISFPLENQYIESAKKTLESYKIDLESTFLVAVFPGVLKPHHRWKMNEFAVLIDTIVNNDTTATVLLLGTSNDEKEAQTVLEYMQNQDRIINFVGKSSFLEALGLLSFCNLLIACDGGAVYMGASVDCSTISLWGPGVMERFKPPGPHHIGVRKNYPCIPCVNYSRLGEFPPCPYNRKCLNDITANEVFEHYLYLRSNWVPKASPQRRL